MVQSGFSLIEVIVAMGMMGAVAIGFMQISKMSKDASVESMYTMEMLQVTNQLQQFFLSSDTCVDTLASIPGGNLVNATEDTPVPFGPIVRFSKDEDGNIIDTKTYFESDVTEFLGGRLKLLQMDVVGFETVDTPAGKTRKPADIRLKFLFAKRKVANDPTGERQINRFVTVKAFVGTGASPNPAEFPIVPANQVDRCFSDVGSAVSSALRGACEATNSFDRDGNIVLTMEFNEDTVECTPIEEHSYCVFGGSFSQGGDYRNPETGGFNCRAGFEEVRAGHFTKPMNSTCGKAKCYKFESQAFFNCVKCYGAGDGTAYIDPNSGDVGIASRDTTVTCTSDISCPSGQYPIDSNGDGCDNSCFDPSSWGGGGGFIP